MSSILKSASYSEVVTPTAYCNSDLNSEGMSRDLSGSTNPAAITMETIIASAILPAIPAAPKLVSPGSENSPVPVTTTPTPIFAWTEVNGATNYGIYIRDLTANVLVFKSQELGLEITGSSYSLPSGILEMGRDYIWSMKSHNSAGWGELATIFYFQTNN